MRTRFTKNSSSTCRKLLNRFESEWPEELKNLRSKNKKEGKRKSMRNWRKDSNRMLTS